jgi:phosphohistidine phosphatase
VELYLVRHAVAENRDSRRWPNDAERPLTAEGAERFQRAAAGLRRIAPHVDRVLSSPYARAWQTAELLASHTGWPQPEPFPALEAERDARETLASLESLVDEAQVALVGHEPQLSELASLILTGDRLLLELELKKGSVILIELATGHLAGSTLRWALTPKVLRRLER